MNASKPLSALLSWPLAAFTIEFDNEAEHRLPHSTSIYGASSHEARHKPWLVSFVMWANCLRYVTDAGITSRALERIARTSTNLHGMRRWGYIKIDTDGLLRLTKAGQRAAEACSHLIGEIEQRWSERYGASVMAQLRESLLAIANQADSSLPDCMPILGYGLAVNRPVRVDKANSVDTTLIGLVSKLLNQCALDFEADSPVSLPLSANVLRILPDGPFPLRNLPKTAGISKEAVAMGVKYLVKREFAVLESGTPKTVALTPAGVRLRDAYPVKLEAMEVAWEARYGARAVRNLRQHLQNLVQDFSAQSPLFAALTPYPENWRARLPKPITLPDFPMVLHRGGFPDGS